MSSTDNTVSVTFTLHRGVPPRVEDDKLGKSYIIFELRGYNIQGYTRVKDGYFMNGDQEASFYGDDELMHCIGYVEEEELAQLVRLAVGLHEEDE